VLPVGSADIQYFFVVLFSGWQPPRTACLCDKPAYLGFAAGGQHKMLCLAVGEITPLKTQKQGFFSPIAIKRLQGPVRVAL
jgi:hypothetical protein